MDKYENYERASDWCYHVKKGPSGVSYITVALTAFLSFTFDAKELPIVNNFENFSKNGKEEVIGK